MKKKYFAMILGIILLFGTIKSTKQLESKSSPEVEALKKQLETSNEKIKKLETKSSSEVQDLKKKLEISNKEIRDIRNKVLHNKDLIGQNAAHVQDLHYDGTVMITFKCNGGNPCDFSDEDQTGLTKCPSCFSPKTDDEKTAALEEIKAYLTEVDPKLKCKGMEPKSIKVILSAVSKPDLESEIYYLNELLMANNQILINDVSKTVEISIDEDSGQIVEGGIQEFGGIFSAGATMTYLDTFPNGPDKKAAKKKLLSDIDEGLHEFAPDTKLEVKNIEKDNGRVLYYVNAITVDSLEKGLQTMLGKPNNKFHVVEVKNPHPMEQFAEGVDFRGYLLYIFPFCFYCRLPLIAIPILPLSIQVTWLKCVLVNIFAIIKTASNLDQHYHKYDFRFMYMVLLAGFVYVARDHEEILLRGVGDLGEDGEYNVAHIGVLEQFISGSAVFVQYMLDYKNAFQSQTTRNGEVRKVNVIMAIIQVIYAGLFISNDWAWFVCSILPFIFLTRLPINSVPVYAHLGAITAASFFIKGKLEIFETFLSYPRSLIINCSALVLFGCAFQINQTEGNFATRWIDPIKKNAFTIIKSICVILQLLVPEFDIKLWFTAHYILLATPNLIEEKVQKYLMGLLIIIQGASILLSESTVSEAASSLQFFIGNGISLANIFLQYSMQEYVSQGNATDQESGRNDRSIPDINDDDPGNGVCAPREWKKQVNQIVTLFTAASIPNPPLMLVSMVIPTFFCMRKWGSRVVSGPIFVPVLYTSILIWSYGFMNASADYSDVGEDTEVMPVYYFSGWNIASTCVALLMGINTIIKQDPYFEYVGKPIKKFFDDNEYENGRILLAYIGMGLMFVILLIFN